MTAWVERDLLLGHVDCDCVWESLWKRSRWHSKEQSSLASPESQSVANISLLSIGIWVLYYGKTTRESRSGNWAIFYGSLKEGSRLQR